VMFSVAPTEAEASKAAHNKIISEKNRTKSDRGKYYWPSLDKVREIEGEFEKELKKSSISVQDFMKSISTLERVQKSGIKEEKVKERCRKINLMVQIEQPFWKQMHEMKKILDQIEEIDVSSKREEAHKGSSADFKALSDVVDRLPQSGHPSQHLRSINLSETEKDQIPHLDQQSSGGSGSNDQSVIIQENKSQSDPKDDQNIWPEHPYRDDTLELKVAEQRILRLRQRKERLLNEAAMIKQTILSTLDGLKQQDSEIPFPTGPAGDSPIHCCFILGLHDLGFEVINKFYPDSELLSLPYENDLDPWRTVLSARNQDGTPRPRTNIKSRRQPSSVSIPQQVPESDPAPSESDKQPLEKDPDTSQETLEQLEDGLYTGETILHIAIVQEKVNAVHALLERGIELSTRASGVFFQPRFQMPHTADLSFLQKVKARIIGIDLELERFAAVKRIENTYSGCYYGEYPLSFAASVGNVDICDLLYCCWQHRVKLVEKEYQEGPKDACTGKMTMSEKDEILKMIKQMTESKQDTPVTPRLFTNQSFKNRNTHQRLKFDQTKRSDRRASRSLPEVDDQSGTDRHLSSSAVHQLMWDFVNAADSFGNTAMHMAVMHNQTGVIDWLMKIDEGRDSLEMLNHEGFTPLTLAARYGKVEVFNHILYQHMSETAWTYGKVCCVHAVRSRSEFLRLFSLLVDRRSEWSAPT
jgi:ankyrin repeat protein